MDAQALRHLPALPPWLTHDLADDFVTSCAAALKSVKPENGAVWSIEASQLKHFDSAALAALLAVHRQVKNRGEALQLLAMPERLDDLATLYGVRDLLPT